ncbi:GxxExxY protein [Candidatus Spyradosoma sp. SGI.093]|uniref:GxxExxY protein n=1 Tax=Candidatus Spyradosoma sp. SGI.093 TaxID=3420583 RepID=UPI003CFD19BD
MDSGKALIHENESYAIRGAVFEVYKNLGNGFLEAVYQEALEMEFEKRGIPFAAQPEIKIFYCGVEMKQRYRPDFVCFDRIVVELKAVEALAQVHTAQMINYLRATRLPLGLLVNFGAFPRAEIRRLRV